MITQPSYSLESPLDHGAIVDTKVTLWEFHLQTQNLCRTRHYTLPKRLHFTLTPCWMISSLLHWISVLDASRGSRYVHFPPPYGRLIKSVKLSNPTDFLSWIGTYKGSKDDGKKKLWSTLSIWAISGLSVRWPHSAKFMASSTPLKCRFTCPELTKCSWIVFDSVPQQVGSADEVIKWDMAVKWTSARWFRQWKSNYPKFGISTTN